MPKKWWHYGTFADVATHARKTDIDNNELYKFLSRHGINPTAEAGAIAMRFGLNDEITSIHFLEVDPMKTYDAARAPEIAFHESAPSETKAPSISAIICTHNRYDLLSTSIQSLLGQDIKKEKIEIIIVDNSSDAAEAQSLSQTYTGLKNVRYVHETTPGLSDRECRQLDSGEWLVGCNLSFRQEIVISLGGFSTDLGRRGNLSLLSNEENHLIDLMRANAKYIVYAPNAIVNHQIDASRTNDDWLKHRMAWQAASDILSHPDRALERASITSRKFRKLKILKCLYLASTVSRRKKINYASLVHIYEIILLLLCIGV